MRQRSEWRRELLLMHEPWRPQTRGVLAIASAILLAYFGVEVAGAVISGSLALVADAAHTALDVGALGLATVAAWLAGRPHSTKRSFGNLRAEVLAALVNGAALVGIAGFIVFEAVGRMGDPPDVRGGVVSLVATGGLLANALAAVVIMRGSGRSLNIWAALFHVGGDALGSIGVIIAGLLVVGLGWQLADPVVSVFIALILVYGAFRVLSEATHVLMEGTPAHVDVGSLRDDIEAIDHVVSVHDIHAWTITSGYDALSAHVSVHEDCTREDAAGLLDQLRALAAERYGIAHVTI
jgi:cobalt-zinc-cadmium efflux system protein